MQLATIVIILVLVAIAAVAVVSVPIMIRSTRQQAVTAERRRPIMGSPARVWVERGERMLRELNAALTEQGAWQGVGADAAEVVAELRITAGQVAEVDHALAQIQDQGLAAAGRLREAREELLVRMAAAVAGLEQARAELVELIATAKTAPIIADADPATQLTSRLDGLRAGLVEVRRLSNPEIDPEANPETKGHP